MALRSLLGGAIFADVSGSGSPLVVGLHGWGRDRSDVKSVLVDMPGTVAALDLPGFGTSPAPPEPWGSADYAQRVGLAIDELLDDRTGPEARALVIGHSLGGRVAVCLAAQRPDLVSGLVLAGVPLLRDTPPGKPKLAFRVMRRLHAWRLVSESRMEAVRQRYGSADYRAAQGVMRQTLVRVVGESYETQLSQLECPAALVWGELDTAAPVDMARRAAQLIPTEHSLDVIPAVGHDIHTARPDLLRDRALELLAQTS